MGYDVLVCFARGAASESEGTTDEREDLRDYLKKFPGSLIKQCALLDTTGVGVENTYLPLRN